MKLLIVGNGGREHTLGWALAKDPRVETLFFAPGNPGTKTLGQNLPLKSTDLDGIVEWAKLNRPDLTVIGPEAPLCAGLANRLQSLQLKTFGPTQSGARLEASKHFTKEILSKAGIPTAAAASFTDSTLAKEYLETQTYPLVVKADGLAAGKGVIIAETKAQAIQAVEDIMDAKAFGDAGNQIVIEEFLQGQEASIHVITDGKTYRMLPSSQDHKRIFDDDQGPNTGGMGAYAPAPLITPELLRTIEAQVFQPLIRQLALEGIDYQGVLYGGLMITPQGPKVLEFNCRFGDPETQVLLPLIRSSFLDILLAVTDRTLDQCDIQIDPGCALTVVSAAPGYPEHPETGGLIEGLDTPTNETQILFHAGTKQVGEEVFTAGGRVLTCTGTGPDLQTARDRAYDLTSKISFPGRHHRHDIGNKALIPCPS